MTSTTHVQEKMRLSLYHALRIVFPSGFDPNMLIKPHRWGNPQYVGEIDSTPVWWNGWSANLSEINRHYRTIYIDQVENILPEAVRRQVFGEEFADAIQNVHLFVVMHVGGFALRVYP